MESVRTTDAFFFSVKIQKNILKISESHARGTQKSRKRNADHDIYMQEDQEIPECHVLYGFMIRQVGAIPERKS